MLSAEELDGYIHFARSYKEVQSSVDEDDTTSQTITESTFSLGFGSDTESSATSYTHDPHAVSKGQGGGSVLLCRPTFRAHINLPHGQGAVVPAQGT